MSRISMLKLAPGDGKIPTGRWIVLDNEIARCVRKKIDGHHKMNVIDHIDRGEEKWVLLAAYLINDLVSRQGSSMSNHREIMPIKSGKRWKDAVAGDGLDTAVYIRARPRIAIPIADLVHQIALVRRFTE